MSPGYQIVCMMSDVLSHRQCNPRHEADASAHRKQVSSQKLQSQAGCSCREGGIQGVVRGNSSLLP